MAVLADNTDVTITSPLDNDLLRYSGGVWVNWTPDYITASFANGLYAAAVHTHADYALSADVYTKTEVYTKTATYTKTEIDALVAGAGGGGGVSNDASFLEGEAGAYYLDWANFTGTPITLAGYGITDAAAANHNHDTEYAPIDNIDASTLGGFALSSSGDRWGVVPYVIQSNGNMDIGSHLNFHVADGSTDSYDWQIQATNATNGNLHFRNDTGVIRFTMFDGGNMAISDTGRLYFDASAGIVGDTYIQHNTANTLRFVAGGTESFSVDSAGIDVTGNITITGLVDGRDVSADGVTLDGLVLSNYGGWEISDNSTSQNVLDGEVVHIAGGTNISTTRSVNASEHTITIDLSGTLDADTLDGINSTSFLRSDATDTATGEITFTGGVNFDVADAIYFESKKHAITYNDGQGNFNIRVGHISNGSTQEVCTEAGYAQHIEWDQTNGHVEFNFSTASLAVDDVVSWSRTLDIRADGDIEVLQDIIVGGLVDGRDVSADGITLDSLVLSNYSGWEISDNSTSQNVLDGEVVHIAGDTNISTTRSVNSNEHTISIELQDDIRVDSISTANGTELVINGGDSSGQATGQTGELVYINSEGGVQINSSPDNWGTGWAGRHTLTLCDSSGNSNFPGNITVSGLVDGRDIAADGVTLDGLQSSSFTGWSVGDGSASSTVSDSDVVNFEAGSSDLTVTHGTSGSIHTITVDMAANITVDNITVNGTVDGRDIASDGVTLDGLAAQATYSFDLGGDSGPSPSVDDGHVLLIEGGTNISTTVTSGATIQTLTIDLTGSIDADTFGGLGLSASGDRYNVIPYVESGGSMDIGAYLDFHASDTSTDNYDWRIQATGTTNGQIDFLDDGGTIRFTVHDDGDVIISDLGQLYFDGSGGVGGNTYIQHNSADNLRFVVGGTERLNINSSGIGIVQGNTFYFDGTANNGNTYIQSNTSDNLRMVAGGTERLNVNSSGCQVVGELSATTIDATSDMTLKKNIKTYKGTKASHIRTIIYDWKDGFGQDHISYGAQEVQKILPQAVNTNNGILSVNNDMVQAAKIAELEEKVKYLMEVINDRA